MSFDSERLWNLLPARLRQRDAGLANPHGPDATGRYQPGPLRALLDALASQVAVVEEELEQLYDNHFVETAAPWALPYLGELLGIRGLSAAGETTRLAPRAEVGNTLAYRRRKGTAAVLEQLARDATGWPAAAVEFFQRLATTQHVNHVRRRHHSWPSLRGARRLAFIDTPFESTTRTVEVRRIRPGLGQWNLPNLGLFLWPLRACSRTRSPLAPAHLGEGRHFRLHPLGLDVPLCLNPATETEISHLAGPENVPLLITRRFLAGARMTQAPLHPERLVEPPQFHPDTRFYGTHSEASLLIEASGPNPGDSLAVVPAHRILICDLHDVPDATQTGIVSRWAHDEVNDMTGDPSRGPRFPGAVLLDPQRGRVVFPWVPASDPLGTFHCLFPADLGGGEYARTATFDRDTRPTRVVSQLQPSSASDHFRDLSAAIPPSSASSEVIEIRDSGHYVETLPALDAGVQALEVRAADERWPVLTLEAPLLIRGQSSGRVTLNGLLITGGDSTPGAPPPVHVEATGALGTVRLRHCTLLPGLLIDATGTLDQTAPRPPALTVEAPLCQVLLEDCILGPIEVAPDVRVTLDRCLVDAGRPDRPALGGRDGAPAGTWTLRNCTIVGNVAAQIVALASNTLFHSVSVTAERRQEGCVRFCWLPADARVPRRHRCLPRDESDRVTGADLRTVRPHFATLRYGRPAYGQLSPLCPESIRRGAEDEAAMGLYHDLFQPQREAHARARLEEYLPFGLEVGLFHARQDPD